jgi:hypothetical protein
MKLVGQFWAKPDCCFSAAILDSSIGGVHSEIMVAYDDGSTVSFENTPDCGFRHSDRNSWIHCGAVSTEELVALARGDQQQKSLNVVPPIDGIRAYEQAVNESLAWRRNLGYSAEEMRRMREYARKRKQK